MPCRMLNQRIVFKGKFNFFKDGGLGYMYNLFRDTDPRSKFVTSGYLLSITGIKELIHIKGERSKQCQQKQLKKKIYEHRNTISQNCRSNYKE